MPTQIKQTIAGHDAARQSTTFNRFRRVEQAAAGGFAVATGLPGIRVKTVRHSAMEHEPDSGFVDTDAGCISQQKFFGWKDRYCFERSFTAPQTHISA